MEKIFKKLQEDGLIEFGSILPSDILQKEFGIFDLEQDYRFKLLNLKEYIEKNTDFICITRNFNIFILELEEMASLTTRRLTKALDKTKKRIKSLSNVPYHELNRKNQIKHMHAIALGNMMYESYKKIIHF